MLSPILALLAAGALPAMAPAMSLTLNPSAPSPEPVGTVITWTAMVSDAASGNLWYRFRARAIGQDFRMIKDYGPDNNLDWTASDREGVYEIEADVRNTDTGDMARASAYFEMQSLVQSGGQPVITPTTHPLVFLYSAPACADGARMRVQFTSSGGVVRNTPYRACEAGLSMNFYLAGMQAQTQYSVHHTIDTGSAFRDGPVLTATTPDAGMDFVSRTVLQAPPANVPDGVLLQATTASNPMATDLNGNVIWYYPGNLDFSVVGPFVLTRPDNGGYFWSIIENPNGDQAHQILREFDLTGRTVLETNAARINEQLAALGKRAIGAFHHEARRLPDGKILVLASSEQILTDVQGPGPVDIIGSTIVVLDRNLQVTWVWDSFDYLDTTRMATLNDYCPFGGCPPLFLASAANDWLHGNAVQQTPDGNLLLSARSQDWVIKIDYANGEGGGDVIWRLGKDGDFQPISTDPDPWFSHQHDPHFLADNSAVLLFDNGNVRFTNDPGAHSRGQLLQLDEENRLATFILNADLGQFSSALGSAQKLPNGDYHFDLGVLQDSSSRAIEVAPSGQSVYILGVAAPEYRSFRMRDLYTYAALD
ncbi:MAG: aryl-sulfate sulfotransferase [Bryobacteraceae bacterium]